MASQSFTNQAASFPCRSGSLSDDQGHTTEGNRWFGDARYNPVSEYSVSKQTEALRWARVRGERPLLELEHYRLLIYPERTGENRYGIEWRFDARSPWRPFRTGLGQFLQELGQLFERNGD